MKLKTAATVSYVQLTITQISALDQVKKTSLHLPFDRDAVSRGASLK